MSQNDGAAAPVTGGVGGTVPPGTGVAVTGSGPTSAAINPGTVPTLTMTTSGHIVNKQQPQPQQQQPPPQQPVVDLKPQLQQPLLQQTQENSGNNFSMLFCYIDFRKVNFVKHLPFLFLTYNFCIETVFS